MAMSCCVFKLASLILICFLFPLEGVEGGASYHQAALDHFHVCTVASQRTVGLEKLLSTCSQQGIEIDILGLDLPYRGNGQKLNYIKQYVELLPDDHIVLFVDGYDVLFLANKEMILQKFLAFNVPFVISAEKGCFSAAINYPNSPTPFRYINSGGYIGYAGFIKKMLQAIEINEPLSDQGQLTRYFLENNFPFTLDYYSQIFLCLYDARDGEIVIDDRLQLVHCLATNSDPCIIHDNGYNAVNLYQKIFASLILPRSDTKLPVQYQQCIAELVDRNPYQLSIKEYELVAKTLYEKGYCNMLVFGVGRDSFLWMELNPGGKTVFLEDQEFWLQHVVEQLPKIQAYQVNYHTKRFQWRHFLNNPRALLMTLPEKILNTRWDIILVDGPTGCDNTTPGRMQSIYMAALLAHQKNSHADVFIHDCDREVEAAYSNKFFRDDYLKTTIDRLRHYKILGKK